MYKLKQTIWYGILSIIVLIGIYGFYMQTTEGHHVTGTSKDVPWGIYIAAYAFFVGASAGATIIGLLIYAFGRNDYKPLGIRAIVVGILTLATAVMFIMADVGQPLRMFQVPWFLSNSSSMFFISSTSYYLFMMLLLVELYYLIKIVRNKASEKEKNIFKWLAILAVPFALFIIVTGGFIFGVIKTREYWNTSLLPMHFIIAALATGTAIMILAATFSSKLTHREKPLISNNTLNHLGLLLATFVAITLLFDILDVIVLKYSDKPDGIEAWKILTEQHTIMFAVNVVCLIVAFIIMVFEKGRTANWLGFASVLVLASIAAYRYNLVIVPQKVALFPGMQEIHYSPTGTELSVTAGIVAFMMLVYWVVLKWKPIKMALEEECKEEDSKATQENQLPEENIIAEAHA